MSEQSKLTATTGCPVADNQNLLTVRPRGPQECLLMEKMAHFNRERMPYGVMHAKGAGA